jgi:hypothetical protein
MGAGVQFNSLDVGGVNGSARDVHPVYERKTGFLCAMKMEVDQIGCTEIEIDLY